MCVTKLVLWSTCFYFFYFLFLVLSLLISCWIWIYKRCTNSDMNRILIGDNFKVIDCIDWDLRGQWACRKPNKKKKNEAIFNFLLNQYDYKSLDWRGCGFSSLILLSYLFLLGLSLSLSIFWQWIGGAVDCW